VEKLLKSVSAVVLMAVGAQMPALVYAQGRAPTSAQELVSYQGPDRHDRLVEAAKKEGDLSVYHAYPQLTAVTEAFSKKYGIKVKTWRSGSEAILRRIGTEANAKRFEVDIVQNNAPENEAAHREKLLRPVTSPHFQDLMPAAVPAHKEWVGITVDVFTAAYNTTKVSKEELPKSYEDLLNPKWKGRLGIEAEDHHWFNALTESMGEQKGINLFKNIAATNGLSVRKGHSTLTSLVVTGDVPLALTVYSWNPAQAKEKGAPIERLDLQPIVGQFSTVAMLKNAPNPATAALFYDFMLTEGQRILAEKDFVATSKKFPSHYTSNPLKLIEPARVLDNHEKWVKTYQEVINVKAN
jgi:iron(III) transport system substrate-binding protein